MRLIDADALIDYLERRVDKFYDDDRTYALGIESALSTVEAAPTIDAIPAAHGYKVIRNRPTSAQYIYVGDDGYGNLVKRNDYSGTPIMICQPLANNPIEYCSECGKRLDDTFQNYCPCCGAKMDEVTE